MKICIKCKESKSIESFEGNRNVCRVCRNSARAKGPSPVKTDLYPELPSNVLGFPYYHVYKNGDVLNKYEDVLLQSSTGTSGYQQLSLRKPGTRKLFSRHRLVALAYLPNPLNLPQVNHIDGNKANNTIENLEWCTASENKKHAHRTGLTVMPKGSDSPYWKGGLEASLIRRGIKKP